MVYRMARKQEGFPGKSERVPVVCEHCGTVFCWDEADEAHWGIRKRFCSEECEKAKLSKLCVHCGKPFIAKNDGQLYCGPTHNRKAQRLRAVKVNLQVACGWCGNMFEPSSPGQKYCSPEHKQNGTVCDRKEKFLTVEAAQAMVHIRSAPGLLTFGVLRVSQSVGGTALAFA